MQWLIAAGAFYVALTTAVFLGQRRLLYLPGPVHPDTEQIAASHGLRYWPGRANYRGFITSPGDERARGTVIVFHGNAGAAADRSYYGDALAPLGFRVLLAQYPGYGGRPGTPSEAALVDDARETIRLAHAQFGEPLYLWGESLGAAVAAAAAVDTEVPVDALVLLTPWDSLPDLAQSVYWYLPARWLVLDRFDSVNNLREFTGRVAIAIAEHDEVIPPRHGQRLYRARPFNTRLWVFPGAGHNSWPTQPGQRWWREIGDYITGVE